MFTSPMDKVSGQNEPFERKGVQGGKTNQLKVIQSKLGWFWLDLSFLCFGLFVQRGWLLVSGCGGLFAFFFSFYTREKLNKRFIIPVLFCTNSSYYSQCNIKFE